MDILEYNRRAWDKRVDLEDQWTVPVSPDEVESARQGDWSIVLTPTKLVPRDWLPDLKGKDLLCLASGGGQQGPILAATGANVTVFDNSPKQLEQDRLVAQRDGLSLATVQGDMADLSEFPDHCFDVIVHPVSNVFAPNILPVWREAFRVLRPSGVLVAGFCNPVIFLFDYDMVEKTGEFEVRYSLPYSALEHADQDAIRKNEEDGIPLEFGHTLEDQIGGQIAAGFVLTGFYEDYERQGTDLSLRRFTPTFIATRAVKP